jgi:hypothetical protein
MFLGFPSGNFCLCCLNCPLTCSPPAPTLRFLPSPSPSSLLLNPALSLTQSTFQCFPLLGDRLYTILYLHSPLHPLPSSLFLFDFKPSSFLAPRAFYLLSSPFSLLSRLWPLASGLWPLPSAGALCFCAALYYLPCALALCPLLSILCTLLYAFCPLSSVL